MYVCMYVCIHACLSVWQVNERDTCHHGLIPCRAYGEQRAAIGSSVDSFYEYLYKYALLFGSDTHMALFYSAYAGAIRHLRTGPWYNEVDMDRRSSPSTVFGKLVTLMRNINQDNYQLSELVSMPSGAVLIRVQPCKKKPRSIWALVCSRLSTRRVNVLWVQERRVGARASVGFNLYLSLFSV
jgi:hypothetical protein